MKKSSIALFAVFGAMLIFSFFFCALTMTRIAPVATLFASGRNVEQTVARFSTLTVDSNVYPVIARQEEDSEPAGSLYFVLTADDTISSPRLLMDRSWQENVSLQVSDSTLRISIDAHTQLADAKRQHTLTVDSGLARIMEIRIPQEMLSKIYGQGYRFDISGLRDADLRIDFATATFTDCQFRTLDL